MPELSFRYTMPPDRAAPERDLLMLEQEQWKANVGVLTKVNFIHYVETLLYDEEQIGTVLSCEIGPDLIIRIYAWPLQPDVAFRLESSVGRLGDVLVGTVHTGESLSFNLTRNATLAHPANTIEGVRWLVGPFNAAGEEISAPEITVSGREVSLSEPVWGSVWVRAACTRYDCKISMPLEEAEPLLAAGWSEFVVGLPEGGRPVALELVPPPGAEELVKSGAPCGRLHRLNVRFPEDGPPTAQPEDKRTECDYCAQECEGEENNNA